MPSSAVVAEILGPDLLIVIVVLVLLFGGSQIPKLARSVGQASKEFRKGVAEGAGSDEPAADKPTSDEKITLTRAELEQLIAEREAKARSERPDQQRPL